MGLKCKPVIDYTLCNGCMACVSLCPYKAFFSDVDAHAKIDYSKCKMCGVCIILCPYGAIDCQWVPTSSQCQSGLKQSS
ncbi:4Fe-4S binding protein [Ignisphaera cupida]|uniref:4Fe-4S binding protein n=1 Tax=Ignisphaera cupida TaxID=3050454 RepID=UPI00330764CD